MSAIQGLEQIIRAEVSIKLLEDIENPEIICDRLGELDESLSTRGVVARFENKVAFEHNQGIATFTELPTDFVDDSYGDIVAVVGVHPTDMRKLCQSVRDFNKKFLKQYDLTRVVDLIDDIAISHLHHLEHKDTIDEVCNIMGIINPFEYEDD